HPCHGRHPSGGRRPVKLQFHLDEWMPHLLDGLMVTVELTVLCIGMGIILGLLLMIARLYGRRAVYWPATVFINFFRGTPILAQLFLVYYGLPSFGIMLEPFTAGVLALGLNTSARSEERRVGEESGARGVSVRVRDGAQ